MLLSALSLIHNCIQNCIQNCMYQNCINFEVKPYSVYFHSINRSLWVITIILWKTYQEKESADNMQSFLAHMDGRQARMPSLITQLKKSRIDHESFMAIILTKASILHDRIRPKRRKTTLSLNVRRIKLKSLFLVRLFQDMIPRVGVPMKPQG